MKQQVPQHVAIIMDGNGRWARDRGLPRTLGHKEGVKRVEEIIACAKKAGIKVLTLFAFSTENWGRPKAEISMIMSTIVHLLREKVGTLKKNNIRIKVIGQEGELTRNVRREVRLAEERTQANSGMTVVLAFNYGSRAEIVHAAKAIAQEVSEGNLEPKDITEQRFSSGLYTHGLPDPDLLIRTSGEKRISNFLLWQLSYAELYFTDMFWPDFGPEQFEAAIAEYQVRERRYGHVGDEGRA